MVVQLEDIQIHLIHEGEAVRLRTSSDNILLVKQTFDEIEQVLRRNFATVRTFYQQRANGAVSLSDLNLISLKIVLRFFYMHNMWRNQGQQLKNKALEFLAEDLEHPYSNDEVIAVLKEKYPSAYSGKCAQLLNMTPDQLKQYEKNRREFFDMP